MAPEPNDRPLHSSRPAPRTRGKARRAAEHRLAPLDYLLLVLISLGVAITIALFIVDPSA